jgi:predicted cupin superfamily sugar epimerase
VHGAARELIETLGLIAHPEGGFYRETFRSPLAIRGLPWLSPDDARSASTAIYFLLPAGTFSAFHRVLADEVWHHYDGDPVDLHTLETARGHQVVRLGDDFRVGHRAQHVVRGGIYQAASVAGDRYALCGCTVAPGFDFADFSMPSRDALLAAFPEHRALVESLTRLPE